MCLCVFRCECMLQICPCLWRLEECEPVGDVCYLTWVLGTTVRFFGEQPVLSTTELSFQPLYIYLWSRSPSLNLKLTNWAGSWSMSSRNLPISAPFHSLKCTGWHAHLSLWIWQCKLRSTCSWGKYFIDSHFLAQRLIFFSFFRDHLQGVV